MLDAGCCSIRRAEMRFIYVEVGGLVGTPEIDIRYRSLQTPIQPSTRERGEALVITEHMAIHNGMGSTEMLYRIERCDDVRVAWRPKGS